MSDLLGFTTNLHGILNILNALNYWQETKKVVIIVTFYGNRQMKILGKNSKQVKINPFHASLQIELLQ